MSENSPIRLYTSVSNSNDTGSLPNLREDKLASLPSH